MGAHQSRLDKTFSNEEVNFDHFQILRAIGKGSFGKVCIVQKKDTKQMYAMKYMHKIQCLERDALKNVLREVDILTQLEHPFLVNLWFSFQDEEDLFMVSDLLLGGDLRYHIAQDVSFTEEGVRLYICELGSALDYLQSKSIIHRDIKPDNILLDEDGHAHITDFNIATVLKDGQLATSMSGTKPYIAPEIFACVVDACVGHSFPVDWWSLGVTTCAPEIFACVVDACVGYSFPVDWWSLGVTAYEVLARERPYDIHSATSIGDVRALFGNPIAYPRSWSAGFVDLISKLLCVEPGARVSSLEELRQVACLRRTDFEQVLEKQTKPAFQPPRDHLNCDPTFELEEMIVEARPLHKKKKRLAKQRSLRGSVSVDITDSDLDEHLAEFRTYNREKELIRREMERKEQDWEQELIQAMNASSNDTNCPPPGRSLAAPSPNRRRSSCKLNVTPSSVQTRLAATPSRTANHSPSSPPDTIKSFSNSPTIVVTEGKSMPFH